MSREEPPETNPALVLDHLRGDVGPPLAVPITDALFSTDDPRELILGSLEEGGARFLSRGNRYLLVAGEGGVGKSRLVVRLMVSLALGRADWLGAIPINPEGGPLRCLYVQHENSESRIKRDLNGFRDADSDRGLPWSREDMKALGNRVFYTPSGDALSRYALPVDRRSETCPGAENLAAVVKMHRPDVVVLDPLADFLGARNENDNAEVGEALTRMLGAIRAGALDAGILPPAVVLVHHGGAGSEAHLKLNGSGGKNNPRGATAIVNRAGALINIWPAEDENGDSESETLVVSTSKMNDGRRPPEFAVRFDGRDYALTDFDVKAHKERLREEKNKTKRPPRPSKSDAAVAAAKVILQSRPAAIRWGDMIDGIRSATGCGKTVAADALEILERDNIASVTLMGKAGKMYLWRGEKGE